MGLLSLSLSLFERQWSKLHDIDSCHFSLKSTYVTCVACSHLHSYLYFFRDRTKLTPQKKHGLKLHQKQLVTHSVWLSPILAAGASCGTRLTFIPMFRRGPSSQRRAAARIRLGQDHWGWNPWFGEKPWVWSKMGVNWNTGKLLLVSNIFKFCCWFQISSNMRSDKHVAARWTIITIPMYPGDIGKWCPTQEASVRQTRCKSAGTRSIWIR